MLFECNVCNYITDKLYNYKRHSVSNKHIRNLQFKRIKFSNYCELCGKSFDTTINCHNKYKCKAKKNNYRRTNPN